ncbi:Kef-type potassium/proton antiporter (CPA2 family) [Maritimibacter alkaliphilus HTCC2654]|uniref:Putative TrkA family protein n=1 Tax=Maritimibacter alkaliphilus HTCC2654 TaxID=314271 RepID=A3VCP0_9RHOB|nr:cation:proton antiporter [Maritimibacter alkaliphilus]EAQ13908.1 putative TrkA family protein [Maritimibacter alkaliphilus HTCC2654]TYP84105.1 Kef-type potassium/proton antiporter (CPA2 family) [Maritimibacter alkaliphilus HTCC2654]
MTDFLLLAFVFLIAGVVAVPIASRLGLGSVLGYLIAGIVISPVLAWLHVDVIQIQHFAEFGVVMMLFLVGLELEPRRLWEMRARLLGLGGGQVGLTALLVMGVAMVLGQPWSVSLAVGLVLALSSTAIVLQTLGEKGLMRSDGGQSSFSVLLFQDIAVIPMLALIPLLAMPELVEGLSHAAEDGDHSGGMSLVDGLPGWGVALVTVGAIAVVVGAGIYLVGPIFRFIAGANLRELFVATALMFVIGIALLMSLVGLSPALGTFLAGVVLANSEYRHELESDIDPFRGLLLGLFFMTVGAGINFALLFDDFVLILALTLGLIVAKMAVLYVLSYVFKVGGADRWLFSLGLAQAGEFGFVLLSFTVANAVIPGDLADQLLLVVALSMLLTPALFILYDRVVAPRFSEAEEREMDAIDEPSDIIIAGHGRVGGIVARMLRGAGLTPTVIDFSARQLEMLKKFDVQAYYGDATRPDLLHAAGIEHAKLLVIAIDDKHQITELVTYVKKHYPDVHVIARAVDRPHVYDLWWAGCRDIIRETYDSSLRMSRSAVEALGYSRDQADRVTEMFAEMDRSAMLIAAEHYDPAISILDNEAYIEGLRAARGDIEAEFLRDAQAILAEGRKARA